METKEKFDVYAMVTEQVIAQLEKGIVPWHKPWKTYGEPSNYVSKKPYRGVNLFLLSMTQYACPYWLSFKQAKEKGGSVRAGEKGTPVVFWNWLESKTERDAFGKPKKIPFLRYYTVFNVEQCEGIEWKAESLPETPFNPIEQAEAVVSGLANGPRIENGGNRAFYRPSADLVQMPLKESFDNAGNYYHVLFHELTHSTGHESRLNRPGIIEVAAFGSQTYAKEELVAEMGAAFLSAKARIENTLEQTTAYIQNWLTALRNDKKLVVNAAAQAQKAADLILGTTFEPTE